VTNDPHRLPSIARHLQAVAKMRQMVVDRADYVARFLACQDRTGDASDGDGDGFAWCNDCNDGNAGVNPGAVEICGNGIDDNCNAHLDAADACL